VNRDERVAIPAVRVDDPALAFTIVLRYFAEDMKPLCARAIHPTAVVDDSVRLGTDVAIGANVVVEDGVEIGDRSTILPGTVILRDSVLGSDCFIYANVTIRESVRLGDRVIVHPGAVLGSDGFGYVQNGAILHKVPHIGTVEIGDDVEIGANACIDRATTGVTQIGRGTKIDNLVQIAHNVKVGESSVLCAQVGVSGSTEIGSGVTLAGQVGLVGHIRIGDQAVVGAQSGVSKSVPAGRMVSGYPARKHSDELRRQAALSRLPGLMETVRELRRRLDAIEGQGDQRDRKPNHDRK
jgi:UDP-3-O-[3-hydroxymyristoyl] glucosamine N-acyltransferase